MNIKQIKKQKPHSTIEHHLGFHFLVP